MSPDKYKATWISHSSSNDFLTCPRLYYFRAIYKDPKTGHKINIVTPPLTLGGVIHDVIESLSVLPVDQRLKIPLIQKFDAAWKNISGEKGGFKTKQEENKYYQEGKDMIKKVTDNPGPILNKAVKIPQELPYYWLSEKDEIILCGKIDWLEYLPDTNSVHIIDFKSGKHEEKEDSLQLPIYHLLVKNTQKRNVEKASYWYLRTDEKPRQQSLPDLEKSYDDVFRIAKRMKLARQLEKFDCPFGKEGCGYCIPFEQITKGKGKKVGESNYRQDIYIL